VILDFTPAEEVEVQGLQNDCAVGAWLIPVGYRAGLKAGVRRAIAAAEAVPYRDQLVAIRKLLED
jgi:hypothetical protein